jgi:pre-mRNA-splicing factor CDC5/CEF1
MSDLNEQIEQAQLELSTFSFLKDCETKAIPKRLQMISGDVERQMEREKKLQDTFSQGQYQLQLQVLQ